MSQQVLTGGTQENVKIVRQEFVEVLDIPGTATAQILTENHPPYIAMDPAAGAVNVDLPVQKVGLTFTITNKAAATGTLVVRLAGGGATVETVPATQTARITCISTVVGVGSWRSLLGAAT